MSEKRLERVLCFDKIDSTNNYLRAMDAPDGQVVITDSQSSGRGRLGRTFVSPAGKGLYLSMLMYPEAKPEDISCITAQTAVAVSNAIFKVCGVMPGIKWVNDLVLNRRKVCGILTELAVTDGRCRIIIGIGINVNNESSDFPPELQNKASSLALETGHFFDRAQLAAEIISELDTLRDGWPNNKGAYLEAYRQNCITTGNDVLVISPTEQRKAFAMSVNDDYSLLVRFPDGSTQNISSGEVSVRGLYDYI